MIIRCFVVPVAAAGKTVKRRERKQKMQRKQEQKEGSEEKSLNDDGSTDSEADSDEICSAGKCQRPKGKQELGLQNNICMDCNIMSRPLGPSSWNDLPPLYATKILAGSLPHLPLLEDFFIPSGLSR